MKQINIDLGRDFLKRYQKLQAERQVMMPLYEDIATYIRPQRLYQQPYKKSQNIYDSTAIVAAEQLASCLWSFLCDGSNRWFSLDHEMFSHDEKLTIENKIYEAFDQYGFYNAAHELFRDLVSFGSAIFVSDGDGQDFSFKALHPLDCVFDFDHKGQISEVFRSLKTEDEKGEVELIHYVFRNKNKRADISLLPWASVIFNKQTGEIVRKGGYEYCPYNILRFYSSSHNIFGESPAMQVLADIKMLNQMVKTNLTAAQKQIDPPLLAADELSPMGIRTHPGAVIYGGIDGVQNRRLIEPLITGGSVNIGLEMEEQRRRSIKEAFYYHITSNLNQKRSATEVIIDFEDKLRLIYPLVNRVFSEFIRPLIAHMSHIILEHHYGEGEYKHIKVTSLSPLALMQKQNQARKLIGGVQSFAPLLSLNHELKGHIDSLALLKLIASYWGIPEHMIADENIHHNNGEMQGEMQAQMQGLEGLDIQKIAMQLFDIFKENKK